MNTKELLVSIGWGMVVVELATLLFFLPSVRIGKLELGSLSRLNWPAWDRFQRSFVQKPDSSIVIVAWDNQTTGWFTRHGGSHALAYKMLGETIQKIRGAGVILMDIFPTWRTGYDREFAAILRKNNNVVLGTQLETLRYGSRIFSVQYKPEHPIFYPLCPVGYANFESDQDGVLRTIPLYPRYDPIAVLACLRYEKASGGKIRYDYWPFVQNMKLRIRYAKNPDHLFPIYSMLDVLAGDVDPGLFKNKLVMLGYSDTELIHDEHTTPVGEEETGADFNIGIVIHALVARNLLNGSFLKVAPDGIQIIILLGVAVLISILTASEQKGRGFWTGLLAISLCFWVYFVARYMAASKGDLVNVAGIWFAIGLCYFLVLIRRHLLVESESAWIRSAFMHYVGPEILSELTARQDLLAPQGGRKDLTILFADIRGFTSLSENEKPERVVEQLREFFEVMGRGVIKHGGYINKFLGDGFMVLFGLTGAPDHPLQALRAANEMVKTLEEENGKWRASGKPPLSVGIGVHTGTVLWGNIGTEKHLEFTAIGDAVNVAARIQELTKHYSPFSVLFSEKTLERIPERERNFSCRELGEISVRGRKATIKLFGLHS